ncbi:PIN domain-containing protein [Candidatus Gottesmanbacteria bacterium]|nr:PIN domain-containing protein [Candidatus Gottesmanbacteria bacterium]
MGVPNSQVLVDSNIFLRLFVRDDEQKWKDSMRVLQSIAEKQIMAYIPTLVAAEVTFVLTSFYRFEKPRVVQATKSMISISNLKMLDDLSVARATQLYEEHNIKFTDCLLASSVLLQSGQAAMLSYDHDFDTLGIRRLEPGDVLKQLKQS